LAKASFGSLVGSKQAGSITSSYATGSVSGALAVGGLVGYNFASGTISGSYASTTGSVTGSDIYTGGLVGLNQGTINSSSYASRSVSGTNFVGGLVGQNEGLIENSYATGSVTGSNLYTGGLVGLNKNNGGTIKTSYATGSVSGVSANGGLVGQNESLIENSYATGGVNVNTKVTDFKFHFGGLVGYNTTVGRINSSYATGIVASDPTNVGGLVGNDTGTINNSFSNSANKVTGTGRAGTGLDSDQMKQSRSFTGFDISNTSSGTTTWFSYDGHTAPLLRGFLTPLSVAYTVSGSKTYDGTTACGNGITCSPTIGTQTPGKSIDGAFALISKNVGTVTGDVSGLYSDQQGYLIAASTSGTATIDKANLVYTANQASSNTGNEPTGLSGTVSGFVKDENQNTATTGTLVWTTPATSASSAGSYAINGSGLVANNYSFSQDAGNSTALTLTPAPAPAPAPVPAPAPTQSVFSGPLVPVVSVPPLPSNTSFARSAQLAQNTQPFSDSFDINSLSPAGAETEEETTEKTQENGEENASRPTGSTGMLNTKATGL
jgi:hypothetical protein